MIFSDYIIVILLIALGMIIVLLFIQGRLRKSRYAEQTLDMVKKEMEHLLMQINNVADQHITLIDDRSQQLKKLVTQAQKITQLLKKETEKNLLNEKNYSDLLKKSSLVQNEQVPLTKHQRILRHHREGMLPSQIAATLSISVSEIELALSLQKAHEGDSGN